MLKIKTIILSLTILLTISSCASFSFKKPVANKDCNWDGVTTYRTKSTPILDCDAEYCTYMSEADYIELVKLIKSCRVWNKKRFEKLLTE